MLKKILISCVSIALIPFCAFAISYSDIQNNPSKYVIVHNAPTMAGYVNVESINILRSSMPYVTVEAEYYTVMFNPKLIIQDTRSFTFDANHGIFPRTMKILEKYPNCSEEELLKMLVAAQVQNSGVMLNSPHFKVFTFAGALNSEASEGFTSILDTPEKKKVGYGKIPWDVANFIFAWCSKAPGNYFGLPGPYSTYSL